MRMILLLLSFAAILAVASPLSAGEIGNGTKTPQLTPETIQDSDIFACLHKETAWALWYEHLKDINTPRCGKAYEVRKEILGGHLPQCDSSGAAETAFETNLVAAMAQGQCEIFRVGEKIIADDVRGYMDLIHTTLIPIRRLNAKQWYWAPVAELP